MGAISPASRLAICFVRPFRSYLDGHMLISSSKDQLEKDLRDKMEEKAEFAKKQYPNIDPRKIDYAKEGMIATNLHFINHHETSYGEVLPTVIDQLTLELEKEITAEFSEEEIEQLLVLANNPLMKKLLSNTVIFGSLKRFEIELELKVREKMYASLLGNALDKMRDTFADLKKKYNIQDPVDEYTEEPNEDEYNGEDHWDEENDNS